MKGSKDMEKSYMKVREYLWNKLYAGEFKAGDKIPSERELAELLQISRNSVREGLKTMENLGVIETQHGAGNFICRNFDKTLRDVMTFMYILNHRSNEQITEFRYGLEWEAVNLLVGNLTDEQKEILLSALLKLENAQDERERVRCDKALHYFLIEATGNEYMIANFRALTKTLDAYIPKMRCKIINGMQKDEDLKNAHRMIVEGIVEGDKEKALVGLQKHFQYIIMYQND